MDKANTSMRTNIMFAIKKQGIIEWNEILYFLFYKFMGYTIDNYYIYSINKSCIKRKE